jgi:hypothetical protein
MAIRVTCVAPELLIAGQQRFANERVPKSCTLDLLAAGVERRCKDTQPRIRRVIERIFLLVEKSAKRMEDLPQAASGPVVLVVTLLGRFTEKRIADLHCDCRRAGA